MIGWFLGSLDLKNILASQDVETPFSCANLVTFPTPRMNPSNDLEAQTGGNEGQLEDTIEKRLGNNNTIQSSGMYAHRLTTLSPHLSSSRELWGPFRKAVVDVSY